MADVQLVGCAVERISKRLASCLYDFGAAGYECRPSSRETEADALDRIRHISSGYGGELQVLSVISSILLGAWDIVAVHGTV